MTIRRLPDDVVNRIAAGEILIRPVNAVKELIENSVDAGASEINITIGNGGLQTIQISDNGCGIRKDDHPLLCERFATSKISSADALADGTLSSFGFRGEALASMSLVGHVSVSSKSLSNSCDHGFESRYSGNTLLPGFPAPIAFKGDSGTRIVVDDLFYNNPVRKHAFKSPATEYRKIMDLISRFAVTFPSIAFRLRKSGDLNFDLCESESSRMKRVESLFGISSGDLVSIVFNEGSLHPIKSCSCILTNPVSCTTSQKVSQSSSTIILVVNKRLVELPSLAKQIESGILLQFQARPSFIFIDLHIEKTKLDVNVCPTKGKVVFANQTAVCKWIADSIIENLIKTKSTKAIKLNKIEFSTLHVPSPQPAVRLRDVTEPPRMQPENPSEPSVVIKLEEASIAAAPASQPFRIHTCPRQIPLSQEITSSTQGFLSLSQKTEPSIKRLKLDPVPSSFDTIISEVSRTHFGEKFQHNPRDFVFVGSVTSDFVLCQYYSHLCICNVRRVFYQVVGKHMLGNGFCLRPITVTSPIFPLPSWLSALMGNETDGTGYVPSIRNFSAVSETEFGALCDKISTYKNLSPESLLAVVSEFIDFIWNIEFSGDHLAIWNEVIKNKRFYSSNDCIVSTSPPGPLGTSKNFSFCEIISLKELYKEFERCYFSYPFHKTA